MGSAKARIQIFEVTNVFGALFLFQILNITLRQHSPKAPTFGGLIRYELSRQLNGEDWFLLFYRSISCQFQ
jgi:hypothetical protein